MGVFPTDAGFGTKEDFNPESNPMLADTGLRWPFGGPNGELKPVYANDLFRAVHDAFGHGLEGSGFRAEGEENAWQAHIRLFTGPARGAITTETRGQNSWLNYGPYGERNRTAKTEDTVFADQKTGLMPEWTWNEGIAPDEGSSVEGQRYMPAGDMATGRGVKDNSGNVIPLSQRFKATSEDIRFMPASDQDTKALQMLPKPRRSLDAAYRDGVKTRSQDPQYYDVPDYVGYDMARTAAFEMGREGAEPPRWVMAERIGKLPTEGRSKNFAEDRMERGVSVLRIVGEPQSDVGTYEMFNPGEKRYVAGWLVGLGSDGEPLLADAVDLGPASSDVRIQRDIGRNQDFATPPTDTEAVDALSSEKKAKFGAARSIKPGTQVAARIDIPAFLRTGKYVVAVHEPDGAAGGPGKVIGYDTVTRLQNPKFVVKPGVQRIYEGKSAKFPVATVDGKIMADRSIPGDLENYVPVGMDPKEHAFFYDKRTDQPVIGGSESVSVGNTVFVKNPVYGDPSQFAFMPSPDSAMPGAYSFPGGYRAIPGKAKGSLRLYGPAGSLIGIAASLDEAQRIIRKKSKQ
jgi:hypothetical protein